MDIHDFKFMLMTKRNERQKERASSQKESSGLSVIKNSTTAIFSKSASSEIDLTKD
jgi:hypothetical protein